MPITDRQFQLTQNRKYGPFHFTQESGRLGSNFLRYGRYSRVGSYIDISRPITRQYYKYLDITSLSNGGSRVRVRGLKGVIRGSWWEDISALVAQVDPETASPKDLSRLNSRIKRVVSAAQHQAEAATYKAEAIAQRQMEKELSRIDRRERKLTNDINRIERVQEQINQAKKDADLHMNAEKRHKREIRQQIDAAKKIETDNKSQQVRRLQQKKAGRDHLEPNRVVNKRSNKSVKLFEGKNAAKTFSKLANNRWLRRGAIGFAAMFAFSKVQSVISSIGDRRAIPEHYDKGYDIISENLTDFGSPVNLWKTAAKTITPYKSSTRRGLRTSTRQILESNPALDLAANAIKHQQY